MILSDAGIKAAIETGQIEIEPQPAEYSPSAVDLLLGDEFNPGTQTGFWFPVYRPFSIWRSNVSP